MNKVEAKKRIKALTDSLNRHNYLYHVLDTPEISDQAFDTLRNELAALEKEFPDLLTETSPTQRIGGSSLKGFTKFRHTERMPSLNDSFDFEETTVQMKEAVPASVFKSITDALSIYTVVEGDALDPDADYDIIITVGQKSS